MMQREGTAGGGFEKTSRLQRNQERKVTLDAAAEMLSEDDEYAADNHIESMVKRSESQGRDSSPSLFHQLESSPCSSAPQKILRRSSGRLLQKLGLSA